MKIKIIILPIILLLSLNISLSQSKADLISQIDDKERKYKFYYNRLKDSLNFRNHEISLKFNKIIDSLKKENLYFKEGLNRDLLDSLKYLNHKITNLSTENKVFSGENMKIRDSLNFLKNKMHDIFHIDGNIAKQFTHNNNTYDCYFVNLINSEIKFYWKHENKPILSIKKLEEVIDKEKRSLVFATNAGMYLSDHSPQGLFIQNGKTLVQLDKKKEEYGNFYMQPNGVFSIDSSNTGKIMTTDDFIPDGVKFATQSGPIVLLNGEINQKFGKNATSLNIRSGVGIIDSNNIVFVISNQKVNFYDFATIFKEKLNCSDAIYLDGAISEMFLPELSRFQNGGEFGPIIGIVK
jgi:uncharacterized protein YigE (DUF2233 family)